MNGYTRENTTKNLLIFLCKILNITVSVGYFREDEGESQVSFLLNDQNACPLLTSPSPGRRESAGAEGLLS